MLFSQLANSNFAFADDLAKLVSTHQSITQSMSGIAEYISNSHLSKFNGLDAAIKGITGNFINELKVSNSDDFALATEASEAIEEAIEDYSDSHEADVLREIGQSIIAELTPLLEKTKTQKATNFILHLMAVMSFLCLIYDKYNSLNATSIEDVIEESKNHTLESEARVTKLIERKFRELNKTRLARTNVDLKYAPKAKSQTIGTVKMGQLVTVIEIRHKFLLIAYIDQETGEPKSGFVMKKYFKEVR